MSIGEKRVRFHFDPHDLSILHVIKHKTVDLIDLCDEQRAATSEHRRLWELAMTHYEEAAMWAEKAAEGGF